jgi:SAM-dependent methyltransferase
MNSPSNPHHDGTPSDWVVRHAHLLPRGGTVLDVAAGRGRNARYLAACGLQVVAVDRDADALGDVAGVAGVTTQVADLETGEWPFAAARFDAVVVVHYLHRPLLPLLRGALAAGGVLLYETFAQGNEAFGRPRNPDFLLAPGELLAVAQQVPALTVVAFEQGRVQRAEHAAVVQRIAAVAPGYLWPPALEADPATAAAPAPR